MITDKGYIIPTYDEIYTRKLAEFKTVKANIRETDSNLIIPLLKFDAIEEYDLHLKALAVYNNLNVYTATGANLNDITSHLNMTWEKEKRAIGEITITGDIGTVIPQAYGVETKNGIKYVTRNTTPVTMESTEITLPIIALNGGKTSNVSPAQITEQTEILVGITNITNKIGTYGGKDKETDTELRERYLRRLELKSSFTTEGIKRYILNNTDVKKCQVLENDTDEIIDGMLPHSYEAICLGDTNENIFKALYDYKLAGIRTVGDIKKQFGDITVGFSRPIEIKIDFKVDIKAIKDVWKEDYKQVIDSIVRTYIDSLEPQETIYSYKLLGEIYKHTGGINEIDIVMGKQGTSLNNNNYQLQKKEIAIVGNININVVI